MMIARNDDPPDDPAQEASEALIESLYEIIMRLRPLYKDNAAWEDAEDSVVNALEAIALTCYMKGRDDVLTARGEAMDG